jgi:hypothetical protein
MEVLIAFVAFILLDLAAMSWGYDSRQSLRSEEERLAALGVTWSDRSQAVAA